MASWRGKPVDKAALKGLTIDFGIPLNAATASNPANYQVEVVTTKKVKKGVTDASGGVLGGTRMFTISRGGQSITPS